MTDQEVDLIVVGGGPGGYTAAIRAAQLGMQVAVVEEQHLGGICLNWGCIPTKALLRTSDLYRDMLRAQDVGISAGPVSIDVAAAVERSRRVSAQLSTGVAHLLRKNKVTVVDGRGRLDAPGRIEVSADGAVTGGLRAPNIIVATGARARTLPELVPDGRLVWTYLEAMTPERVPRSILIVGSGAIGIEFASFYRALGAEVTVAEVLPRILPAEDAEIAHHAHERFEQAGIRILTDARVTGAELGTDSAVVTIEGATGVVHQVVVERVISAVGVVGNVENLGLESTAVQVEGGVVVTDGASRTGEAGVFAVGDVAGPPMLAHKAQHEGIACVEAIAGLQGEGPLDPALVPRCTYSHPQIASVGLTEEQAEAAGHATRIGRFPFRGNGKALAMGEPDGLVKTVFDATTGELLGAHMVGVEVTELVHGFVVAMNLETTEADLMRAVFPHPTLSEMMHESVLDAYGRAIHI